MSSSTETLFTSLTSTSQLDQLQTSIIQLQELLESGELELVLEQPGKSTKQKMLFVTKQIEALVSPELRTLLLAVDDLEFFPETTLQELVNRAAKHR